MFRYIENIFFVLWWESPEKLNDFISFAQNFSQSKNLKSKIEFEINQSSEYIKFLDVRVSLKRRSMETSLYHEIFINMSLKEVFRDTSTAKECRRVQSMNKS